MFADLKYSSATQHQKSNGEAEEESGSAIDKLGGDSTVWDLLAAQHSDMMNFGGSLQLLRE